MNIVVFSSYQKSSICRKTLKLLDLNNIYNQLTDIVRELPLKNFGKLVLKKYLLSLKGLFDTRSKSFKSLDLKILNLTKKKIIDVLLNSRLLTKRPSLIIKKINFLFVFNGTKYVAKFK